MNATNRLHRAGLATLAVLTALFVSACADGFFFDPAPAGLTPISVQYSLVGGAGGPQSAGAGGAFDKADGAQVVLRAAERELFNQRVALEASGTDKKLTLSVDLPAGSAVLATLSITLVQGQTDLFSGSATATLTPGQAAQVDVPLTGVVGAVQLNTAQVRLDSLGGTFSLSSTGVFASGDTLGPVTATYRALGSAVSVSSSGLVTAVSNGSAGVEATYLGKADTATFVVDDRCVPVPLPAFGTVVNGVLDDLDCQVNAIDDRVGDWFGFTLTQQTAVRLALTSPGYIPRWWLYEETGPGRGLSFDGFPRAHQLDATPGFEAVVLPPGTYRLFVFAAAGQLSPRGSYSLSTSVITEDNDFLCPADDGKGTLWITPGYEGDQDFGGGCTGNTPGFPVNQDRFGVYLEPGTEYIVRTSAPGGYSPEIFLFYADNVIVGQAVGANRVSNELRYTVPPDEPGWHGLTITASPGDELGPYHITFLEAANAPDPCAGPTIDDVGVYSGTLDWRSGCYFMGVMASEYRYFTLTEETSLLLTMTSDLPTNWGIVEASGPIDLRRRFVTGSQFGPALATLPQGDYSLFVSAQPGSLGDYQLTVAEVTADESVPCTVNVHVVPGFLGLQTLDSACQAPDGRNLDRYRVRLDGGQTYTVSATSNALLTELSVIGPGGQVLAVEEPGPSASAPQEIVGPGLSNLATFTAPTTDWYIVTVKAASFGASGGYTFQLLDGLPTGSGSLTGSVALDGLPAAGVTVTLNGPVVLSAVTNGLGNYSITGIPLGVYTASFSGLPPGAVITPPGSPFVFDVPNKALIFNFFGTALTTGTLSGLVTGDGVGLQGVVVTATTPGGVLTTLTDALGAYSFPAVQGGSTTVSLSGFMWAAYDFSVSSQVVSVLGGGSAVANFAGLPESQPLYDVNVIVQSDPNGHEPFIQVTPTPLLHVQIDQGNKISIFSLDPLTKWVPVSGTVNPDGTVALTGKGTVAGFPNIDVLFNGVLTDGLDPLVFFDGVGILSFSGTLTMGPGNQLPADIDGFFNPAIYTVTGSRVPDIP
jgi:hypothetical protein